MRSFGIIQAGGRALLRKTNSKTNPPLPTTDYIIEQQEQEQEEEQPNFSGRVHSESYSANNLSAAFDSILSSSSSSSSSKKLSAATTAGKDVIPAGSNEATRTFLAAVKSSTLATLEDYRRSILDSLAKDDPNGRIYCKNVRQMKDILAYERWRKKLDNLALAQQQSLSTTSSTATKKKSPPATPPAASKPSLSHRKELDERPSISDPIVVQKLIHELWHIDQLVDATILVSYSGQPLHLQPLYLI
jgi:hypothetical protein